MERTTRHEMRSETIQAGLRFMRPAHNNIFDHSYGLVSESGAWDLGNKPCSRIGSSCRACLHASETVKMITKAEVL